MASLCPPIHLQFFDPVAGLNDAAKFLSGGLVYTYATGGTTTPKTTWTNGAGDIAHANPIVLDSSGAATVYLTPGEAYRFVVQRANGSTVAVVDPVTALDGADIEEIVEDILAAQVLPVANGGTGASTAAGARTNLGIAYPVDLVVACSDEGTELVAGTAKLTFRAPRAMTLSAIHASLGVVSSSGVVTVDVLKNGVSLFTTKITIDASQKTSRTATIPHVLASTSIAADDELIINLDTDGTGAKGLKVYLIGTST